MRVDIGHRPLTPETLRKMADDVRRCYICEMGASHMHALNGRPAYVLCQHCFALLMRRAFGWRDDRPLPPEAGS